MSASQSVVLTSAAPGPVYFKGGRYLVGCIGTGFGTVAIQALLPDGTTYATVPDVTGVAASFAANGWKLLDLAPGQYKLTIATATAVTVNATSIPT